MGYEVNYNEPHCYNGVPSASIIQANKNKKGWGHSKNVAPLHWNST